MKYIIVISLILLGMSPEEDLFPSDVSKKILKTIDKIWESESKKVEIVQINSNDYTIEDNFSLYKVTDHGKNEGYIYLTEAKGRFDYFDYAIYYDADIKIIRVEVLIYRSEYGGEIAAKGWLKQFINLNGCEAELGDNVSAISGATLSAPSITIGIKNACKVMQQLQQENVL